MINNKTTKKKLIIMIKVCFADNYPGSTFYAKSI
jgi:hypothetical protein